MWIYAWYYKTATTLVTFKDTLNEYIFDDGWFLLAFFFLWQSFEFMFDGTRKPPTKTQRGNWQEHQHLLIQCSHFHQTYHMSLELFDSLVEMLRQILVINETRSYARSEVGPIIAGIRLHSLMRYLTGGLYLDICTLVSTPHSEFYHTLEDLQCYSHDCPGLE